ncbi:hypothetical protein GCM10011338_35190 [Alteromonas lipolytica]|nr:hypothetical protein GCM10011338_35190 [Alteromonas lipolytica]
MLQVNEVASSSSLIVVLVSNRNSYSDIALIWITSHQADATFLVVVMLARFTLCAHRNFDGFTDVTGKIQRQIKGVA